MTFKPDRLLVLYFEDIMFDTIREYMSMDNYGMSIIYRDLITKAHWSAALDATCNFVCDL